MRNEIDGKFLLGLYSKVEKHGHAIETAQGSGFELAGVQVSQGFDGYDVYFSDGLVSLTLGFHHSWHANAVNEAQMTAFLDKLKYIDQHYS